MTFVKFEFFKARISNLTIVLLFSSISSIFKQFFNSQQIRIVQLRTASSRQGSRRTIIPLHLRRTRWAARQALRGETVARTRRSSRQSVDAIQGRLPQRRPHAGKLRLRMQKPQPHTRNLHLRQRRLQTADHLQLEVWIETWRFTEFSRFHFSRFYEPASRVRSRLADQARSESRKESQIETSRN